MCSNLLWAYATTRSHHEVVGRVATSILEREEKFRRHDEQAYRALERLRG